MGCWLVALLPVGYSHSVTGSVSKDPLVEDNQKRLEDMEIDLGQWQSEEVANEVKNGEEGDNRKEKETLRWRPNQTKRQKNQTLF